MVEQILKEYIGGVVIQLAVLQAENAALKAELEKLREKVSA
jgi:hypothetical protein